MVINAKQQKIINVLRGNDSTARGYSFWLRLFKEAKVNQTITSWKNIVREAGDVPCNRPLLHQMIHNRSFRPSEYARLFSLLDSTNNMPFVHACMEETEYFWCTRNFSCSRNWLQMGVINALDSEFFTRALKRISGKHFGAIAGMINSFLRSNLMTGSGKSSMSKTCRRIELGMDAAKIVEESIISNKDSYRNYWEAVKSTTCEFAILCFNSPKPVLDTLVFTILRAGKSMAGDEALNLLFHVFDRFDRSHIEPGFSWKYGYHLRRQTLSWLVEKCEEMLVLFEKVDALGLESKEEAASAYLHFSFGMSA